MEEKRFIGVFTDNECRIITHFLLNHLDYLEPDYGYNKECSKLYEYMKAVNAGLTLEQLEILKNPHLNYHDIKTITDVFMNTDIDFEIVKIFAVSSDEIKKYGYDMSIDTLDECYRLLLNNKDDQFMIKLLRESTNDLRRALVIINCFEYSFEDKEKIMHEIFDNPDLNSNQRLDILYRILDKEYEEDTLDFDWDDED